MIITRICIFYFLVFFKTFYFYPIFLFFSSQPVQNVETTFQITRANVHMLESGGYDVQAWCILLNDSVQYRMQWPQYPDLKVNGMLDSILFFPTCKNYILYPDLHPFITYTAFILYFNIFHL